LPESYYEDMRFVFLLIATTLAMAGEFTTSIGGVYPSAVSAITTDPAGNTYVVGSRQLPGTSTFGNPSIAGQANSDVFLTKLKPHVPGITALQFSTYLGEDTVNVGYGLALAPDGTMYIAGTTGGLWPNVNNANTQNGFGGGYSDGFIAGIK